MAGTINDPVHLDAAPSSRPRPYTARKTVPGASPPQNDGDYHIEAIDGARYRPRYHQNLNRPAESMLNFFYERLPDDYESDDSEEYMNGETTEDEVEEQQRREEEMEVEQYEEEEEEVEYYDDDEDEDQESYASSRTMRSTTIAGLKTLKLTFKRAEKLDESIAKLPSGNGGPNDQGDRKRSLLLEAKLPEADALVQDLNRRLTDCLDLNKDLETGVVSYSKWSIEIICEDGDMISILMAYGSVARWQNNMRRSGPKTICLLSYLVPHYSQPKKVLACTEFDKRCFRLPIKFFPPGEKKMALAFMANMHIRYDAAKSKLLLSGLYHYVPVEGNVERTDFHTIRKTR
ncbi:hypothetical protein TWF696_003622 [Orbilia brochopaga]|uniref:Uncharacterized protein n=1 Tax=Orbilia brochopaga TaxID=3140254 RepID=A0AAV9TXU5_9PEZI